MMTRTLKTWTTTAILLSALSACGSESEPPPAEDELVVAKATASGDAQTAAAGTALADPLAVIVTRNGAPAAGITVTWSVLTGGGSLGSATSATNGDGIATTTWTLGPSAGSQSTRATVTGASGSPVAFSATASAGSATSIASAGGGGQSSVVNTALGSPLIVQVTDEFGNGVAGVDVAWAVTVGGGSVAPEASVTGATGTASTVWTLGSTVGTQTVEATAAGLAGSPVEFTATGSAAPDPNTGITVGNDFFSPETRTVPAGTTVTWTWVNTGGVSHSVESVGVPSFASSAILSGNGQTYSVQFNTPGTYDYQCAVHGSAMSGTVVVQ